MRLNLIRHTETAFNAKKIIQGHLDIPLSDTGLVQASRMKNIIEWAAGDRLLIASSDLSRCKNTCLHAMPRHLYHLVKFDQRLRDKYFGRLQGLEYSALVNENDGETWEQFSSRSKSSIDSYVQDGFRQRVDDVVIFTHGGLMKLYLSAMSVQARISPNDDITRQYNDIVTLPKNGSHFQFKVSPHSRYDYVLSVMKWNDTSHLIDN
ncbi:hypothetical protein MP228_010751 [Amoeboaphelidium protococcarum]|nr:hypothetical protein MP228_010751 [Amoeboaphelidium protococcarum]